VLIYKELAGVWLLLDTEAFVHLAHPIGMRPDHDIRGVRTTERAVCQLCGDEITTINGGRHSGSAFVSFERLLNRHMEERHANVCVLPADSEHRIAA
jgi:hypothetical protein